MTQAIQNEPFKPEFGTTYFARIRSMPITVPSDDLIPFLEIYFRYEWQNIIPPYGNVNYDQIVSRCPYQYKLLIINLIRQGLTPYYFPPMLPIPIFSPERVHSRFPSIIKDSRKPIKDQADTLLDQCYWYYMQGCGVVQLTQLIGHAGPIVLNLFQRGYLRPNERQVEWEKLWRNKVITPNLEKHQYTKARRLNERSPEQNID